MSRSGRRAGAAPSSSATACVVRKTVNLPRPGCSVSDRTTCRSAFSHTVIGGSCNGRPPTFTLSGATSARSSFFFTRSALRDDSGS